MSHLIISKKNEVYLTIQAEPHIYYELRDAFQFEVPNAKFSPAYKNKWWDGRIYLFNVDTREIYVGLLDRVIQFNVRKKLDIYNQDLNTLLFFYI